MIDNDKLKQAISHVYLYCDMVIDPYKPRQYYRVDCPAAATLQHVRKYNRCVCVCLGLCVCVLYAFICSYLMHKVCVCLCICVCLFVRVCACLLYAFICRYLMFKVCLCVCVCVVCFSMRLREQDETKDSLKGLEKGADGEKYL